MKPAVWILAAALCGTLAAQIAPYPGGYPGNSGPGIPLPSKKKKGADPNAPQVRQLKGKLVRINDKSVTIHLADEREIECRRSDQTKLLRAEKEIAASEFKRGDTIEIEATEDKQGFFTAQTVRLEKSAPPEEAAPLGERPADAEESGTMRAPKPVADDDEEDPGPPSLKRGAHRASKPSASAAPTEAELNAPAAGDTIDTRDPVLEKARATSGAFTAKLPNYVCKEFITRYLSTTDPPQWKPLDIVSAEVIFNNDKETYRNLEINGKPVRKSMEEIGGAWSTGEFGSILEDLFLSSTAAEFEFRRNSTAAGLDARVYGFTVEQPNSHWHIQAASQAIFPAYKGSIWIDTKSSRVLRIEMQTRKMPKEYPFDVVETSVDYEFVRLGTGQFLLPVHSETLTCQRGTTTCTRNAIEFRNYHKFESESNLKF